MKSQAVWIVLLSLLVTGARTVEAEEGSGVNALLGQARDAYRNRHVKGNPRRALRLYEKIIAARPSYDAYWEGARAVWFVGDIEMRKAPRRQRATMLEKGVAWSREAVALEPDRAEGHLWLGILLGLHAVSKSLFRQMSVAREIRLSAERAIKIDATVECGAGLNLLGSYYQELPGALGGDDRRAVKLLEKAVRICPVDPYHHISLAQALRDLEEDERARAQLDWVLSHDPPEPGWGPEYRFAKTRAREILAEMD